MHSTVFMLISIKKKDSRVNFSILYLLEMHLRLLKKLTIQIKSDKKIIKRHFLQCHRIPIFYFYITSMHFNFHKQVHLRAIFGLTVDSRTMI